MVVGLHTLICEVTDMDRAVEFYRDTLGFTAGYVSPHWSSLQVGQTRIGLHPPFERSQDSQRGGWVFGLEVLDIRAFRARLETAGVTCTDYHDTPAGAIFDFTDPDGNRLQAMQPGAFRKDLIG
jgi:catechol 2,3-dioxygenase-like lactoylglutathione lyase family enzyme